MAQQNQSDRLEIYELKYRCCWAIDHNDAQTLTDVFTSDGTLQGKRLTESDPYVRFDGHEELLSLVQPEDEAGSTALTQHRPYNPVLTIDGDTATGKWYVTVISVPESKETIDLLVGTYEDSYRRVDGTWKIDAVRAEFTELTFDSQA